MRLPTVLRNLLLSGSLGASLGLLLVAYSVFAFSPPTQPPPNGNVSAPLNVSGTGQTKSGGLTLNTGGATYGLIVDQGNVGFGTTTPGAKLEVAGQVKITGGSPGAGKVLTSDASGLATWVTPTSGLGGSGTANYVSKFTAGTTLGNSTIYDNGNVGIGTTSPDSLAHINKAVAAGSDNFVLRLQNPTTVFDARVGIWFADNADTGSGSDGAGIQVTNNGADGSGHITFGKILNGAYTENVRFQSGGNVGIGTTGPAIKLAVGDTDTGFNWVSDGVLQLYTNNVARIHMTSGGNVGIDTTGPAIKLAVGDTDTGLNWVSDGVLQIYTDNVARIHMTNNGNVGINTTSPGYKLDIWGSAWNNIARVYSTGSSSGLNFFDTNGIQRGVVYSDSSGFGLLNNTANWAVRVNQGTDTIYMPGSVGIGTTSPGTKLEVAGQVKITGGSPGAGKVLTSDASGLATWTTPTSGLGGSGTANYISKFTAGTTLGNSIIYDDGTNVGIGTTGPTAKLHVSGDIKAQGKIHPRGDGTGEYIINGQDAGLGDWGLGFYTAFTNRIYIKNDGNVGIGTTTPGAKLEVSGQVKITGGSPGVGKVLTSDAAGLATWTTPTSGLGGSGTANYISKFTAGTTLGNSIIYDNGTNVGIGVTSISGTPSGRLLEIGGSAVAKSTLLLSQTSTSYKARMSADSSSVAIWSNQYYQGGWALDDSAKAPAEINLVSNNADSYIFFGTKNVNTAGATERMRITSSGNVGIGTTSPGPKLDVADNVRIWDQVAGQYPSHATLEVNADTRPTLWMESVGENTGGLGILDTNNMVFATERNLQFRTNASFGSGINSGDTRLTILQNGNIGIGTTSPISALEIRPTQSGTSNVNSAVWIFPTFAPSDIQGASAVRIGGVMKPASSGVFAYTIDMSVLNIDFSAGGSTINSVDSIIMGGTFLSGSRSIYDFSTVHIRGELLGGSYTGTIFNNNGALWVTGEGIVVGSPTGRNKGYGTINVERDIYKNNTPYNNPDYVFEHWATGQIIKYAQNPGAQNYTGLWDIADLEQYVGKNFRFPQIGSEPAGIFDRADLFLELIEQAYLYLFNHEGRIQSLEAQSGVGVFSVEAGVTEGDIVVPGASLVTTKDGGALSKLVKSSQPYQPSVMGVASKETEGRDYAKSDIKKEDNPYPVVLSGRAKVKVNLENGPIKVGDAITTSSTPGVGMAAKTQGYVVGTALAPYDGQDSNVIFILVVPR